jgi:hypothetical protein
MLSVIMLSVIMLSVIMLSVIMLSIIMLSVIMLSVIMLPVVVPFGKLLAKKLMIEIANCIEALYSSIVNLKSFKCCYDNVQTELCREY